MSEITDRYALPLLQAGQAQKEVTHNEALLGIDTLLHLAVETAGLNTPRPVTTTGQAWIVASGGSGAWAGRDAMIASFGSGGWRFVAPRDGCIAWLRDAARFAVFTPAGWRDDGWPVAGLRIGTRLALTVAPAAVAAPTGGAVVDIEARARLSDLIAGLRMLGLVA